MSAWMCQRCGASPEDVTHACGSGRTGTVTWSPDFKSDLYRVVDGQLVPVVPGPAPIVDARAALVAERDTLRAERDRAREELAALRKDYLDVADAIARESSGPADLIATVRLIRAEREVAAQLWSAWEASAKEAMADLAEAKCHVEALQGDLAALKYQHAQEIAMGPLALCEQLEAELRKLHDSLEVTPARYCEYRCATMIVLRKAATLGIARGRREGLRKAAEVVNGLLRKAKPDRMELWGLDDAEKAIRALADDGKVKP